MWFVPIQTVSALLYSGVGIRTNILTVVLYVTSNLVNQSGRPVPKDTLKKTPHSFWEKLVVWTEINVQNGEKKQFNRFLPISLKESCLLLFSLLCRTTLADEWSCSLDLILCLKRPLGFRSTAREVHQRPFSSFFVQYKGC